MDMDHKAEIDRIPLVDAPPVTLWQTDIVSACYFWRTDRYLIHTPKQQLDITAARLSAFGIDLRSKPISDTLLLLVIAHVADYEQRMSMDRHRGVTDKSG